MHLGYTNLPTHTHTVQPIRNVCSVYPTTERKIQSLNAFLVYLFSFLYIVVTCFIYLRFRILFCSLVPWPKRKWVRKTEQQCVCVWDVKKYFVCSILLVGAFMFVWRWHVNQTHWIFEEFADRIWQKFRAGEAVICVSNCSTFPE